MIAETRDMIFRHTCGLGCEARDKLPADISSVATELQKQLITISAKAWGCRNTAKQLVTLIESIRTTMKEIQYSGVELPSHRQAEICMLFEKLEKGKKLTEKILSSRQWNLYQKLTLARKMEKFEKTISSFLKAELLTNKVADVHHLRGDSNVWQSSSSSSSSSSFNDSLMTRSREFPDRISFREMDLSKVGPSGTVAVDRENTVELVLELGHSVSVDGDIFSVSEASLLDQQIQAQECIQQLEAEIATYFSQLQHHNMMSSSSCSVDSKSICSLITPSIEFPDHVSFRKMDLSEAGPSSRDSISFRIRGVEGEMDRIDLSRGVFGPEDLAISFDDWEAYKKRSSSNVVNRFKSFELDSHKVHSQELREAGCSGAVVASILTNRDITELTFSESRENGKLSTLANKEIADGGTEKNKPSIERKPSILVKSSRYFVPNDVVTVDGGIKGVRPPVLKPPPSMNWPHIDLHGSSWDLTSSTPSSENGCVEEEAREEELEMEGTGAMLGDKADESCSFTTDEDETSSTVSNTSPIYASGGSIITSWQKGQLLGRGSFGSVYEGISGDGDFFAVKEVSLLDQGSQAQECIQQLEGEIKLLSQLQHQNIVRYRGTAKDESNLYIFLELVTQGSLLKLYQRYQLRYSVVSMYTRQILDGLKYLHDKGFIHRDIKCANILVDANGAVKLADFGLAKVLKDIKSCVGKPFWMAPEVINPKRNDEYGSPADIWSLGCTVLEMCTGQIPYSDLEPVQALFKIGMGVLPEIPETISQDARDFILKCLKVNPDKRPTAAELLNHPFVRRPCVGESRYEYW